jgi:mannose-6-phosphate isomerase class I
LRENASDFVGDLPVKVGEIISFPVLQIHSLRHGIKVIEFQTPHYERLILMFAQKVLTQNHWDTEEAINKMQADVYHPPKLECIQKSTGLAVERFNEFPQFAFDRICLLIVISGQAEVSPLKGKPIVLNAEESLFMPVAMGSYRLESTGESQLICLKAAPK